MHVSACLDDAPLHRALSTAGSSVGRPGDSLYPIGAHPPLDSTHPLAGFPSHSAPFLSFCLFPSCKPPTPVSTSPSRLLTLLAASTSMTNLVTPAVFYTDGVANDRDDGASLFRCRSSRSLIPVFRSFERQCCCPFLFSAVTTRIEPPECISCARSFTWSCCATWVGSSFVIVVWLRILRNAGLCFFGTGGGDVVKRGECL